MRLLIMGPQGVGKGTQAALLAEHFNIPTISTGDIFRYNIKNKTELGLEAMSYTDKGELVPDSLTNKIVKDRLAKEDCKNGWILDGYPRNAAQQPEADGSPSPGPEEAKIGRYSAEAACDGEAGSGASRIARDFEGGADGIFVVKLRGKSPGKPRRSTSPVR